MNDRTNMIKVAVVGGEGIGPEVTAQSHRILNWFVSNRGVPVTLREAQYGLIPYLATGKTHRFEIDPRHRAGLLRGLDEVALTLQRDDEIRAFQAADRDQRPWIHFAGKQARKQAGKQT